MVKGTDEYGEGMKINIVQNVLAYNKEHAKVNRDLFKENRVYVVNLLSSPGAGKTSLIIETIKKLKDRYSIGVIEGDIASTHDAEKIRRYTSQVVQINTGGSCHLNASMINKAIEKLNLAKIDLLFIENVGNLICPVGFDLGEDSMAVISSVSEGDDKPVKYPKVFIKSDLILLNKIDMLGLADFNKDFFTGKIRELNTRAEVFELSCIKGTGLSGWTDWISAAADNK